ncbi:SAP domain-containing protein [Mycena indigotica]|uniref:ATP-dependent DNA helicase II subunit 1 n=1 Tax=Mycena indigotica TaxID=2126181 RepID=A0A8H6W443_9AGAR|nr:SAP domain-containing protein [Mycena indigotica]KAF7302176.1 SAP domain-containing protein [Mycena indigotica]
MAYDDWNKLDEEEEEELQDYSYFDSKKDVILFCIDCSESMLELREDPIYENAQTCHAYIALEAAMQIQKKKVITGPNDSVGILLFNTSRQGESSRSTGSDIKKNCFVYQPIAPLSAPKIQDLIHLLDAFREDPEELKRNFPPLLDGKKDLTQSGVAVEPFFISTKEKPFDVSRFYSSVLLPNSLVDEDDIDTEDPSVLRESISISRIEDLLAQMRFHEVAKRAGFSVPFQLANGFTIGVKGYGLVTEQKKGSYKYFMDLGDRMEVATVRTSYVDEEQQSEVEKTRMVYGMGVTSGGDDADGNERPAKPGQRPFYNAEEIRSFRTLGLEPSIKLLGFKDLSELKFEDNVKHSLFIYPDELTYAGSKRTFSALLQSMIKKKKMGLVLALVRRNASPTFCALLPQAENMEDGWADPPGFHLIPLPFADDIRSAPIEQACRASEDVKDAALAWINKLSVKNGAYPPDSYPNPALAFHNAQLQATAFGEEFDVDEFEDLTLPKVDMMHKRAGKLWEAWKSSVANDEAALESGPVVEEKKRGTKRKAEVDLSETEIRTRVADGTLAKLTNDQLKTFLKSKGQPVSGKNDRHGLHKQLALTQLPHTVADTEDHPGRGPSAIPEDKKEELLENAEDNWQDDPINPRNWSLGKKWTSAGVVSFYTFISPLSSSIMAPGLPDIALKYNITNETIIAMTLSIFLISFAIGTLAFVPRSDIGTALLLATPVLMADFQEMYGRRWVMNICNLITIGFNLGCAFAPTTGALLAFRFLVGFSGSAPIACGGGVISDLFSERDRAAAMAIYSLGPLIGPVVGPIAGGFVTQKIGIKYVFIIVAGLGGIASAFGIPFLRETYAPVIRLRRAKNAPDPEKAAAAHPVLLTEHTSKLHYLWINLSRPAILLCRSVVCFLLSLYMAFMYGIYYLMFATFSTLFSEVYGFGTGIGGLTYIGLGVGFMLATIFSARWGNDIYLSLSQRNGGKGEPEMRIPALILGSLFVPVGLFWYGWSAEARIHWIMPIIGSGIFGFGMMTTFLPIQLYLVDTFTYAASALSAASVFRSLLGFAFPLFGQQMFNALGTGGGNSLLGGLGIVLGIPFPIYLYYHGAEIRQKSAFSR